MNKDNKNTEVDNTDKKLHISDVISSFSHTSGGFEQSFKWLIENGYTDEVMKKVLYNGGSLVVQIIDLGNDVKKNYL
jgi:hypothetical protein